MKVRSSSSEKKITELFSCFEDHRKLFDTVSFLRHKAFYVTRKMLEAFRVLKNLTRSFVNMKAKTTTLFFCDKACSWWSDL